jgi:transcriptional regulator with XRE-family HTH domain
MLHEELRRAREEIGYTQAELAALAGIPRNQIARAEKGENITLDTLRKIVVHLPVTELNLLDTVKLSTDTLPIHDKIYVGAMNTLHNVLKGLSAALEHTQETFDALQQARSRETPEEAAARGADVDPSLILKGIEGTLLSLDKRLKHSA